LWTTPGLRPGGEDSEEEVVLSSEGAVDSGADRHSAVDEALSNALEAAAASSGTTTVADVVEEVDAASDGETTSRSGTVMHLFKSSQTGPSWRRLTLLVSPS
jgi:hypothetical protein